MQTLSRWAYGELVLFSDYLAKVHDRQMGLWALGSGKKAFIVGLPSPDDPDLHSIGFLSLTHHRFFFRQTHYRLPRRRSNTNGDLHGSTTPAMATEPPLSTISVYHSILALLPHPPPQFSPQQRRHVAWWRRRTAHGLSPFPLLPVIAKFFTFLDLPCLWPLS